MKREIEEKKKRVSGLVGCHVAASERRKIWIKDPDRVNKWGLN